jgi:hypothetical protein
MSSRRPPGPPSSVVHRTRLKYSGGSHEGPGLGPLGEADTIRLTCAACEEALGTATSVTRGVSWDLYHDDASISIDVVLGVRVELERGFTNATRLHPTGLRWYRRRPGSRGVFRGRVRLPAVLTCAGGHDSLLDRVESQADQPMEHVVDELEKTDPETQEDAAEANLAYGEWLADQGLLARD